jgi:hypothetical protein
LIYRLFPNPIELLFKHYAYAGNYFAVSLKIFCYNVVFTGVRSVRPQRPGAGTDEEKSFLIKKTGFHTRRDAAGCLTLTETARNECFR